MKRILATLALLLSAFHILSAVPAYPGKIKVTQPDGSVITIQLHGDEWYHYATDEKGRVVARGADGFFHLAEKPSEAVRAEAAEKRKTARRARAQAAEAAQASGMTLGTHRIPVILVEFQDTRFSIDDPKAAFDALLNEEGYSANGGTGSVRDFYVENSHGLYEPVFEVYGPYLLSQNRADYANNAAGALTEACEGMNGQIDFSRYDSDGDNNVDMTLMYYAGHNQAETQDETTIWPHQSGVWESPRLDGKYLGTYFCTSELRGWGPGMCGIGTTTHEFAHSLGLPDFYDTDDETNGAAGGLYDFSTMCSGNYNNNGRTPPYFNAEELMMLGWLDEGLTEITRQGALTIVPIQNRVAYKVPTSTPGEYFMLECRDKTGWDSFIPNGGLLVYHVDKSQRKITIYNYYGYRQTMTAENIWRSTNSINENGSHPCFYLIPAADQSNLNLGSDDYPKIPFPGTKKVKTYTPVDWEGVTSDFKFTNINFSNGQVKLNVSYTTTPGVAGTVMNTSAKPVRDAKVSLYAGSTLKQSATTSADGTYSFEGADLADATLTVKVTCNGFVDYETEIAVGRKVETLDIYLRKEGESTEVSFGMYDPAGSMEPFGAGNSDFAAGIKLTSDMLAAYAGKQLKMISFQPVGGSGVTVDAVYVFVDAGGRRQFTQKVDNVRLGAMNTVNVIAQDYTIPSGTTLYVGYALTGCSVEEPVMVQECTSDKMGYYGSYPGARAVSWKEMNVNGKYYTPILSAFVGEPVEPELGFNYIANPGNGSYKAGDRFTLELVRYEDDAPSTVAWTFDGQSVQGGSVTLTAGSHTVEAYLTYPDGSNEVIRLVISAK
ncbi:MAG: M6 family metalloprotease domain-containing protein [Bacteroidales bacterium]|nr:M6 family metalloprotease domain-containing protein [Bacteroidales bacterium]